MTESICAGAFLSPEEDAVSRIEGLLVLIHSTYDVTLRESYAKQLSEFVKITRTAKVKIKDIEAIDGIAALLSDQDDIVRFWAAASLGRIGPPANRALPALEQALKEITPPPGGIGPSWSSDAAITLAIKRIKDENASPNLRGSPNGHQ